MFIWNFYLSCNDGLFVINGIRVLPKFRMKEFITSYGLKIYTPVDGAVNIWDSKLPASPNSLDCLSLRKKNISDGFCIKGKMKFEF